MKFKGLKPTAWQKVVHDSITEHGPSAGMTFVVKARRQCGKSIMIEQELLRHAINYKNSVNICVSLTMVNCRKIYKEILNGIIDSGIVEKSNDSQLEIELINGSTIIFKSAEQKDRLRGYTIRNGGILCIDECAYINDEIFNIIGPWVDVNNANTLMVSTPRIKSGVFYDMYMLGMSGNSNKVISFDWSNFDTSEMLNEEKLELYRKTIPHNQFLTEYLGEFADENGSVFDMSSVKYIKGGDNGKKYFTGGYNELYFGIDWGTGSNQDRTVITCFDENKIMRGLWYSQSKQPNFQVDYIKENIVRCFDMKKIKAFLYEENSIGKVYGSYLRAALPDVKMEAFTTTNDSKREIIEDMCAEIGDGNVTLWDDDELKREFSAYQMEMTPTGKITYNAPYGLHDDIVMASCIALHGLKKAKKRGNYSIVFSR